MYKDLIHELRYYASEYRSGATLGRMIEDTEDVMDAAADAIEELSQSEWISVKDKLPNLGVPVIVARLRGKEVCVEQGCRDINGLWWMYDSHARVKSVTHWMPLPAPPAF